MRELGIEYDFRDTAKEPLSAAELKRLVGKRPIEDFLNPRSTSYRKMGLKNRKISRTEAIRLMVEDGNFIRRPILISGSRAVFGFDDTVYREL